MVCFKVAVRLFVGLLDMTPVCVGRVPAGVDRKLLEKSAAAGMKLIGNPAKLVNANFCGFATSAHAKCAFLVLQKISRD